MPPHHKPRLLISVRTAAEAVEALAGGADIIDIKEPANGPLGRADDEVWRQVVETVGCRASVSVALGELGQGPPPRLPENICAKSIETSESGATGCLPASANAPSRPHWRTSRQWHTASHTFSEGIAFAKVGLAGAPPDWEQRLLDYAKRLGVTGFVPVAYADGRSVAAPPVELVLAWACRYRAAAVMIDTANKRGGGLFDWVTPDMVAGWIAKARRAGVAIALAGSLRDDRLAQAIALMPDIVGVRGAACQGGDRMAGVNAQSVRGLANLLATRTATAAAHAG